MNVNKYGILILQKKEVDKKERFAEIISESIYMKAADIKVEDLNCDDFRDFYGDWRGKDIKSLITMEVE